MKSQMIDCKRYDITFSFSFHKKSCYEESTGICSVLPLLHFDDHSHLATDKSNIKHCPLILKLMRKTPDKFFPTNIWRYSCGHFSMGSDMHRICISGKIKSRLPTVFVGQVMRKYFCDYCEDTGNNQLKTF
jgi:hypothetical protein